MNADERRWMRRTGFIVGGLAGAAVGAGIVARRLGRPRLAGQSVLITGGSRGLGLALAREFALHGCRVAICARDSGELERARLDLEGRGAEVFIYVCDVTDREQVEALIAAVIGHYGSIDILVNNAGVIQVGPVEAMTLEDFRSAMDVMFWGTVYPTMALLPRMLERNSGRIVNITSIGGKVAVPHLLPYTCAKFAAMGFSEGLRAELSGRGIRVTTIAPGLMRTGSYLNALVKGQHDREARWFGVSASTPLITMGASRAARQIVAAVRSGRSERVLTMPANLMARFHGLAPGVTAEILGLVNRLILPSPTGPTPALRSGETRGLNTRTARVLTGLGRAAAGKYLQPQTAEVR